MHRYLCGAVVAAAGLAGTVGATVPPALEPLVLVQSVSGQGDGGPARTDLPAAATRPNEWVVTAAKAEVSGPTLAMGAEEEVSGNAATYYMGAVAELRNFRQREFDAEKLYALLDAGPEALHKDEVGILGLSQTEGTVRWLREGVRRPQVEWPNDVGPEGQRGQMVDTSGMRELLARLCVDVRWELHEGRVEGAMERLRWGYALTGAMGKSKRVIMRLAAAGDERMLNVRLAEVIKGAGSANMYWALAELPVLSARLDDACREDAAYLYEAAPELGRLRKGAFVQGDWDRFVARLADPLGFLAEGETAYNVTERTAEERKAVVEKALAEALPRAKEWVGAAGAGKSDGEVLARYLTGTFDERVAETVRWTAVPFAEAHPKMRAARTAAGAAADRAANFLLPLGPGPDDTAYGILARADRGAAMMRVVEAVRDYAARHDGKLPETLGAVTELPVPVDPMTGVGFGYVVQGEVGTLSAAAPEGMGGRYAERWVVRIR